MSYILDALRRADSERERGAVPGLRAQPVPAPGPAPRARSSPGLWPWLTGALVVVAAASGAAWWGWHDGRAPLAGSANRVAAEVRGSVPDVAPLPGLPKVEVPRAATVAAPEAVAPAIVLALPNPPAATVPPQRGPLPPSTPQTAARASTGASTFPDRAGGAATTTAREDPAAGLRPPAASPPPTDGRVPALSELPDGVRRGLPALVVSGATYSETPAHRMLIVNGQVVREGEEPAPGVVLERIQLKSAILRHKGTRFSMPY